MVLRIEADGRLRAANDAVLRFMRGHRIAGLWGRGLFASADMMSLEATRYLWAARLDPRRRTYAVGTYAHVLDQWGILYDQPIVLNRRQAGPAIEGALRQQHVDRLERVAVDTHGFTHFAMALAKLVGFDLCPRLAKLKKRKLYLPRGLDVPEVSAALRGGDRLAPRHRSGLGRIAAARRLGEARLVPGNRGARPVRFGRCRRPRLRSRRQPGEAPPHPLSLRLLRQSGVPDEILDLLNQGEAVHSLQRAVYNGMITAKHGRTMEELGAISGALALLANIVMAWNTHRFQIAVDRGAGRVSGRGAEEHRADRLQAHQSARHPDLRSLAARTEPARPSARRASENARQAEKQGFLCPQLVTRERSTDNALKLLTFLSVTFGTQVTKRPSRPPWSFTGTSTIPCSDNATPCCSG